MDKKLHSNEILHAKLNLETAQMSWKDLERFFASGALISVGRELDLVDVAVHIANDDKETVSAWLNVGSIRKVSDAEAATWNEKEASLWTVVVKPWILVQEEKVARPSIH